ncbi:MAG: hypothetical protein Q9167_004834 [Letrouitia subvulpina]
MAFNFNWSPLTADASFYTRAQELFTAALNKSPKPPIIVDDILVNELNLGSVPPDLEILEVGDLAEDRFRGIFKMCYSGDAFLTLKTRVQANPLNTYLSTRPSFTSPQPLAASSSLTIPLQITLSEIKLSAFIILVFSRQKGLTLVFRNDPLESLKVSSTFDAIPFVRDYLQKEIEGQLRTLLMDEVPAIIHRLSLRLWVPEYKAMEDDELARIDGNTAPEEKVVDPLASPPQDPVDISGNVLDPSQVASLSLDPSSETHSLFSQKSLLRLAALTESQRTLSLFTPSIRDVVFRAWAGTSERGELSSTNGLVTPVLPSMSRVHSFASKTSNTYTFSDTFDGTLSSRPPLSSFGSASSGLALGISRHGKPHGGRKKKHRVVNLRKKDEIGKEGLESVSGEGSTVSGTTSSAPSEYNFAYPPNQIREGELITPPQSPPRIRSQRRVSEAIDDNNPVQNTNITPRQPNLTTSTPSASSANLESSSQTPRRPKLRTTQSHQPCLSSHTLENLGTTSSYPSEKSQPPANREPPLSPPLSSSQPHLLPSPLPLFDSQHTSGGILEQAWMMKMAKEIARRVHEEKERESTDGGFWEVRREEEGPPPAYRL